MKKRFYLILLAAAFFLLAVPSQAQVWRSSTGNIFRFHADSSVDVLNIDGGSSHGRWWWGSPPHHGVFQLWGDPTTYNVYVQGNTASVYFNGKTTYWTYLGTRGPKGGEVKGEADRGWLMATPTTLRP
jgi:hypothetical protein